MSRIGTMKVLTGLAILSLAASGCATSGDVTTAQSEASEALRVAHEANERATAAVADAAAARTAADAAAAEARRASEKSDRIFQRTLQK
jgi:hypothetical protein